MQNFSNKQGSLSHSLLSWLRNQLVHESAAPRKNHGWQGKKQMNNRNICKKRNGGWVLKILIWSLNVTKTYDLIGLCPWMPGQRLGFWTTSIQGFAASCPLRFTVLFFKTFIFHLKDHHTKDINLKFQLNWSNGLDLVSNFVYCSCLYYYFVSFIQGLWLP